MYCSVLQYVVVCCSVLQCVVVCYRVLRCGFDLVYIDGYTYMGQEGGSTIEDWYLCAVACCSVL